MRACPRWRATVVVLGLWLGLSPSAAPSAQTPDIADTLRAVGAYVEHYLSRAQSIVGREKVIIQPLSSGFSGDGRPRSLLFDIRLDWAIDDGELAARVSRDWIAVDGRAPRPKDTPQCLDPRALTPEPLEFLRAERQAGFMFTAAGTTRVQGRPARMLDYRSRTPQPVETEWKEGCVTVDLPGRLRGRVWVDVETSAVLRIDEGILGMVDIDVPRAEQRRGSASALTIERADTSIRYRPFTFADPDETLWLPWKVDVLTVIRNSGTPRLRISHEYSDYRRFVTGGRIVE